MPNDTAFNNAKDKLQEADGNAGDASKIVLTLEQYAEALRMVVEAEPTSGVDASAVLLDRAVAGFTKAVSNLQATTPTKVLVDIFDEGHIQEGKGKNAGLSKEARSEAYTRAGKDHQIGAAYAYVGALKDTAGTLARAIDLDITADLYRAAAKMYEAATQYEDVTKLEEKQERALEYYAASLLYGAAAAAYTQAANEYGVADPGGSGGAQATTNAAEATASRNDAKNNFDHFK